jgi:hypothetical protein
MFIIKFLPILLVTVFMVYGMSLTGQAYTNNIVKQERMQKLTKFHELLHEMKMRESGCRHEGIWGDGGLAYGECQYHYFTFEVWKTRYKMWNASWSNRADQNALMARMVRDGYGREWTVYEASYKKVYGKDPPPKGIKLLEV